MALKETQQILETIKRSRKPLICIPSNGGLDAYASAIGLASVLKKLESNPDIVAADGPTPKQIHFLNGHDKVLSSFENLQQFVIELDASKTKVNELSYELKDDKLFVYLSPKKGIWEPKDVKLTSSGYKYDLIIALGSPDLESFTNLYRAHPNFFFKTPIINIDHTPENEHYGQINVVDMTASAIGEVCHDLTHAIEPGLIDEEIATAFLTGMIAKTKSFKSSNVTPKTLQTASKLIAKGADRENIVKNLYRTRSIQTLRLWGRALARLKSDENSKIVWTLLSQQDFMHAGAHEEDLPDVIDELIASSPDAGVVALIFEDKDKNIRITLRVEKPNDAIMLSSIYNPEGNREEVKILIKDKTIVQVEKEFIQHLQKKLKK